MRYADWDVLLFPRDCEVPVKEFKVTCHVVHDDEFACSNGSIGIPTVCCFVPSLPAGVPFQVSIHSWSTPTISQFTQFYSKYTDDAIFEARLFIDGRLVASTTLNRESVRPHVIANSFEFSNVGDLVPLKFPSFCKEILQQRTWSAADDLGRIKIIIGEGFPRDSPSMPIERVKNIIAFSFQHAPLDLLEEFSIAWPNPGMWQRLPFATSTAVPLYPSEVSESHAHSPRRQRGAMSSVEKLTEITHHMPLSNFASRETLRGPDYHGSSSSSSTRDTGALDSHGDRNAYLAWLNGMSTYVADEIQNHERDTLQILNQSSDETFHDAHMSDYISVAPSDQNSTTHSSIDFSTLQRGNEDYFGHIKPPAQMPPVARMNHLDNQDTVLALTARNAAALSDVKAPLTDSLLNQPLPAHLLAHNFGCSKMDIMGGRDQRLQSQGAHSPSTNSSASTSGRGYQYIRSATRPRYSKHRLGSASLLYESRGYKVGSTSDPARAMNKRLPSASDFAMEIGSSSIDRAFQRSCTGDAVTTFTTRGGLEGASVGKNNDDDGEENLSLETRDG